MNEQQIAEPTPPMPLEEQVRILETRANHWAGGRNVATLAGIYISGMIGEVVSKTGEMAGVIKRDVLPEPWDIPDHIGNFTEAGLYTGFSLSLINVILLKRSGERSPRNIRLAAASAFVVSSLIQVVAEKYGLGIGPNHGDMIDAYYGVGFSAVAATAGSVGFERSLKKRREDGEKIDAFIDDYIEKQQATIGENSPNSKPTRVNSQNKKKKRTQQKASRRANRR